MGGNILNCWGMWNWCKEISLVIKAKQYLERVN